MVEIYLALALALFAALTRVAFELTLELGRIAWQGGRWLFARRMIAGAVEKINREEMAIKALVANGWPESVATFAVYQETRKSDARALLLGAGYTKTESAAIMRALAKKR